MAREYSEDEIFESDVDPVDGINAFRREQAAESLDEDAPSDDTISKDLPTDSVDKGNNDLPDDEVNLDEESKEGEESSSDETTEVKKRTFKADGKDYSFTEEEMLEQFEGVFGKAINFTQKTQKLAPYRKMISALEEQNLSQDDFNLALDLLKGDKSALKKLAKDRDIDLSDLAYEEEDTDYRPTSYGKDDFEMKIQEIESSIGKDEEYKTTVDVIDNQWDDTSRGTIAENPNIIMGLHHDIKSGVYAKVAPEAMKLQVLDGNSKSSLEYYILAGKSYAASMKSESNQNNVNELNKGAQDAETKYGKESSEAKNKLAASSNRSSAGKKSVTDYLDDDNDEKFDEWYKKLNSSQ